ncbi:MAG: hypothetical protein JWN43_4754 [Gammaproteobacteria bacterium]|nr:hypothetical protein [Gammaproteobacteria bacterium]
MFDGIEARLGALSRMGHGHRHDTVDASRAGVHYDDSVRQEYSLFNIVRHHDHGDADVQPQALQLLLQS